MSAMAHDSRARLTVEWRQVVDFPRMEVSDRGEVRLISTGRKLRGYINSDGYLSYTLVDGSGKKRHVLAHRIVALTFLGPPPEPGMQVAHLDGSRINCQPWNLAWSSAQDNHDDRAFHGNSPKGEKNPKAKLTISDVVALRREYREAKTPGSGVRVRDLAEKYGLHISTVSGIANGRMWPHIPMSAESSGA